MKNLVFLLITILALSSCSEYSKVLNKGDVKSQYKLAEALFNQGKYNKAMTLFEKVAPSFINKPQLQRVRYMSAIADYKLKNYDLATYRFNRFINNYPKSSKIEEVYFLNSQALYNLSPRSSLEQKDSYKALEALQTYLDLYPNSEYTDKVNNQYVELTDKINKKAYDIAYQYYHTGRYKAAIVAFDNYLSDYLGSKQKEDALFYKFKSAYKLAMNSVEYKKAKRLDAAVKAQKRYVKYYPKGKYSEEAKNLLEKLVKEIEITNSSTTAEK
jgi:outer membrane protein assembly factor BamD